MVKQDKITIMMRLMKHMNNVQYCKTGQENNILYSSPDYCILVLSFPTTLELNSILNVPSVCLGD